ncbi:DUF1028 domain-containing protein [Erwinia sorbitola]|uniref:DUF1028 domain-containing protein n=1 Tax=Erwinia sorbitola TaxID=2681984 RepID=A0A6I6EEK3_9GAMM|nr:DUF1028 domain-containing protein [Erwinia sorbitola]MTD26735.1 DUF1028 domain-containing protein [Erwinia sorbitola]QGU88304.1 DUF1028 domain-containing protein [Erwinia sorbitola]
MTFSIVARDIQSGALAAATATGGPAVGALVIHGRSRTGAIATQALTNPLYGSRGLELLTAGLTAQQTLHLLLKEDDERERRQLLIIDNAGETAHWSGSLCGRWFSSLAGSQLAVAGNMLVSEQVLSAMQQAYENALDLPLADRMLAALNAAQDAGGDERGIRSAALQVWDRRAYADIDLRVDWSDAPLEQLAEVLEQVRGDTYADFFRQLPGG